MNNHLYTDELTQSLNLEKAEELEEEKIGRIVDEEIAEVRAEEKKKKEKNG